MTKGGSHPMNSRSTLLIPTLLAALGFSSWAQYGKDNCVRTDLDAPHAAWLDKVLAAGNEHPEVDHVVVFGHYGIMPGIAWWHSSCMTVYTREASRLNALLKKHT
jgi:hypothetical protein